MSEFSLTFRRFHSSKNIQRYPLDISLIRLTETLTELIAGEERICKKYLALVSPPQIKIESVRLLHLSTRPSVLIVWNYEVH